MILKMRCLLYVSILLHKLALTKDDRNLGGILSARNGFHLEASLSKILALLRVLDENTCLRAL